MLKWQKLSRHVARSPCMSDTNSCVDTLSFLERVLRLVLGIPDYGTDIPTVVGRIEALSAVPRTAQRLSFSPPRIPSQDLVH